LDGFNFNTAGILKTVNKLESVKKELFQKLICGVIDDYENGISSLAAELNEAGFENYLEKLSNQLMDFQRN